jgi:hypothetical protein
MTYIYCKCVQIRRLKRFNHSKGNRKPELMLRSYISQLTIRFPYAAPFEF